ncbi:MAG: hypothetical protein H6607_10170 [Flavobacteriales bacterium]|nr:hypothetical protein [Flavobacteriales bacterium]
MAEKKKKQGRPATKPVEKRKAYYVMVKVHNSMNNTSTNVLISRDTKAEIKLLMRNSSQKVEFLGYWNGKQYEKVNLN